MIAPMKDCTFNVVRVTNSMSNTPHKTAGIVRSTVTANRSDWKLNVSNRKITRIESSKPVCNPERVSSSGGICPLTATVIPRGGLPTRFSIS